MNQAETSPRRVTLADVAAAAGVDRSVVSRVINRDPRLVIKGETRARVLDAVAKLHYYPNAAARSLRTARSGTIGFLIPDLGDHIYAEIVRGAEEQATEQGVLMLTGMVREDYPERYVDLLASGRVDGILLFSDRLSTETIAALVATGRPIVSVNQRLPGIAKSVLAADQTASRMAVEHLLDLGHRRVAHIRGPIGSDTAERRLAGYRAALSGVGVDARDEWIVDSDYTAAGGRKAMMQLLEREMRPTAVLVANVAMAVGAITAATTAGLRVPDDISVVSIHDHPLATDISPSLTTVRMPLAEMGRAGVRALLGVEDVESGITVVDSPMELIVRQSTARVDH